MAYSDVPCVRYLKHFDSREQKSKLANQLALIFPSSLEAIVNEGTRIRIINIKKRDISLSRPVPHQGGEYSTQAFAQALVKISANRPATRAARRLLASLHPSEAEHLIVRDEESTTYRKGDTVEILADEFKTEPRRIRKLLRKLGYNAPYEDDVPLRAAIRGAPKKYLKFLSKQN